MHRSSLIDGMVLELLAQIAKGERITAEHVKRFLEDPERVMPDTELRVEERFVSLLSKGSEETATSEDGDGAFVTIVTDREGKWIAKNGARIHGPFARIHKDEDATVDRRPCSAEGELFVACETELGKWVMLRSMEQGYARVHALPGKPVTEPFGVGDEPACVTTAVVDKDGSDGAVFHVTHGANVYGPYARVETDSVFEVDGKVGYVAQAAGSVWESVFVAGEPLVFRDGYGADAPEYREWAAIRYLVRRNYDHTIVPGRLSFVAIDRECGHRIFHRGRPLPWKGTSCDGMAVDLSNGSETYDQIVYAVRHDLGLAVLEGDGCVVSGGWSSIWDLRFKDGVVSFIGERGDADLAVVIVKDKDGRWSEKVYGPYDTAWGLKIVFRTPVFVARKGDEHFVVNGIVESPVRVARREAITHHDEANGRILQVVRDEERGTDTLHFGERKTRPYDRIYGVRHLDSSRIEFMAQKNRRLIRAWFYFV